MSLFIAVERFGAEKRFLRLRGLFASVGIDEASVLTAQAPKRIFFNVFSISSRYACQIMEDGFKLQDQSIEKEGIFWLEESQKLFGHDYSFRFHITSTISEVMADSRMPLDEIGGQFNPDEIPWAVIKIANLETKYPIFPNLPLTIGSGQESLIQLNLDGIAPLHLRITLEKAGEVHIEAMQGTIRIRDTQTPQKTKISTDSEVIIEPVGLALKLQFPN